MSSTLYDISVASFVQGLAGVTEVMRLGHEFYEANGKSPNEIVASRLRDDMLPFHFQAQAVTHQSLGAIEGVRQGQFGPPPRIEPLDYAGLQNLVAETLDGLRTVDADELNSYAGKPVIFRMGELEMPFTAENFILSFALPNFHFHAATLYDMLRIEVVSLSKKHFLGKMRLGL